MKVTAGDGGASTLEAWLRRACPSILTPFTGTLSCSLGARVRARRRDVNVHSKSVRGVRAMDIFTTLVQTGNKLGICAYAYTRMWKLLNGKLPNYLEKF